MSSPQETVAEGAAETAKNPSSGPGLRRLKTTDSAGTGSTGSSAGPAFRRMQTTDGAEHTNARRSRGRRVQRTDSHDGRNGKVGMFGEIKEEVSKEPKPDAAS